MLFLWFILKCWGRRADRQSLAWRVCGQIISAPTEVCQTSKYPIHRYVGAGLPFNPLRGQIVSVTIKPVCCQTVSLKNTILSVLARNHKNYAVIYIFLANYKSHTACIIS